VSYTVSLDSYDVTYADQQVIKHGIGVNYN